MTGNSFQSSNRLFPFSGLLGDLAHGKIHTVSQECTVGEASKQLTDKEVDYLIVEHNQIPIGIVNKSELIKYGMVDDSPLDASISTIMSRQIVSIQKDQPVLDALMFMLKHDLKHLLVLDGNEPIGVVSEEDWLQLQDNYPSQYLKQVEQVNTVGDVAELRKKANSMIWNNFTSEGNAVSLTNLVTVINDAITKRIIELALKKMEDNGKGQPPVAFAWIGMGSEGRKSQTLQTDQDNALIFENVTANNYQKTKNWFLELATVIVESLDECGFALCTGNIMATNPDLCQSLEKWQKSLKDLIYDTDSKGLFEASIYLDFRCLHGNVTLSDKLWEFMIDSIKHNHLFLRNLADNLVRAGRPPVKKLGWRLYSMTEIKPAAFDIKKHASIPLDAAIRILALDNGIQETHTLLRLQACLEKGILSKSLADEVRTAFDFIVRLRFRLEFAGKGGGADNKNTSVNPKDLLPMQIRYLKGALNSIYELQTYVYEHITGTTVPWHLR